MARMFSSQEPSRSVLVTGGTGFVGSNLVEALLHRGYSVACLVRDPIKAGDIRKQPVKIITGSLDDTDALRKAAVGVHMVFHIAGAIKASDREGYLKVNQFGTRRLLEAFAEVNPKLSRFVHMSSLAAAGPSEDNRMLTEKDPPNPVSWYGESKLRSEQEVLQYAGAFPTTILRPSAVYGPGDRETLLIFRMIKRGCLFTPGRFVRRFSLIHVKDLVNAVIQAGERDTPSGEIYFVSRPEVFTWDDVGCEAARSMGKRYCRISFPKWLARAAGLAGDMYVFTSGRPASINSQKVNELLQPSWICDSSKARADLGFNPGIGLEDGIRDTILWYKAQGWL